MKEKIYIYYTNDLHSDFTYWPKVVRFLKQKKEERLSRREEYFLVDIGDHVDRVHPIAEAFMGKGNVYLLNEAGYDVVTIGNNEGITLSYEDLFQLYDEANFSVVCTNLYSKENNDPSWLERVHYKTTKSGLRIAFLGFTAPFNPYYHLLNWHVENPLSLLEQYLPNIKQKADIVVLLSHLGLYEDREIAERFSEIDVIIGGHTHHLLRTGENINETILTAAGKHCSHVGEVILTWNHDEKKLINKEAYTTKITQLEKDVETVNLLENLMKEASSKLSLPITTLEQELEVNWFKETKLIKKLSVMLQEWTKADCAMLNAGLFLESLPKGEVTYKDIHRICPHPINPVVVEITGRELKEIVRVGRSEEFMHIALKGFGFRGKILGKLIFSNVNIVYKKVNGRKYIHELFLGDEKVIDDKAYSLATADMFTFGRILPEVAKSTRKDLFLPEFLRDLLVETLREK